MQDRLDDYQNLYDLAQRLVGHRIYLDGKLPELLPGRLPDNLPVTLPLPDGCRLLGSKVDKEWAIGLETRLSPEAIFDFYFVYFTANDWKMNNPQPRTGGFHDHGFVQNFVGVNRVFYRDSGPPTVAVQAVSQSSGLTEVWVTINNEVMDSLAKEHFKRQFHVHTLIPALVAPFGARQLPGGGGGGPAFWQTGATLESERTIPMIATHYAAQLEEAGWVRKNSFEHEHYAWHSWTVRDEDDKEWGGLFYALNNPLSARERILYLHVGDPNQRRW